MYIYIYICISRQVSTLRALDDTIIKDVNKDTTKGGVKTKEPSTKEPSTKEPSTKEPSTKEPSTRMPEPRHYPVGSEEYYQDLAMRELMRVAYDSTLVNSLERVIR